MDHTLKTPWTARLARIFAFSSLLALAAGPLLARLGLLAPLSAFTLFALSLPFALLAIFFGLLGLWSTRSSTGRPGSRSAWAALVFGSIVLLVVGALARSGGEVPPIHDITTDLDDPPEFVVLAEAPDNVGVDLTYPHGNPATPELQRESYGDLASLRLELTPAEALERAASVAAELGWSEVARSEPTPTGEPEPEAPSEPAPRVDEAETEGTAGPAATEDAEETGDETETDEGGDGAVEAAQPPRPVVGHLEATATSDIFRFVDDIVVRVRGPQGADAPTSVIDVRSRSRVGQSDLGANAARIRAFIERIQASTP